MTTLTELGQERLREQRVRCQAQKNEIKATAEARRALLDQDRRGVIRLVKRDVLRGAELPAGATIDTRRSGAYGHQVAVRLPGGLSVFSEYAYMVVGEHLCAQYGWKDQRWVARNRPVDKEETFDSFADAVIWLLDIKLEMAQDKLDEAKE